MRNRVRSVASIPAARSAVPAAPDAIALPLLAHNHTPENFPLEAARAISALHAAAAACWVSRRGVGAPSGGGITVRLIPVITGGLPSLTLTDMRW